ncbi:MAG: hypothetical protein EXX96DRAFT_487746 [Benjaminiella poitrasii]|nr:MAG: hypothetical protein EXX96DRAFT_487746 [Benjaminiella poitrasii]
MKLISYYALFLVSTTGVLAGKLATVSAAVSSSITKTADFFQKSPVWLSTVRGPKNAAQVVKSFPADEDIHAGPLSSGRAILDLKSYPEVNKQPSPHHPEVLAVLKQLDFTWIPNTAPRKVKNWVMDTTLYDASKDPDCWWSATLCKTPKLGYIPEDISICPQKGDWGLNFDDGPYRISWPKSEQEKMYDQPRFYNFLVSSGKQKATLFFVGSNIIRFPEAAQRSLNDGHTICSHTWSHPQMTTLTNEEVVAQLYWTQKAIKETLGITPKCWRPPYGDVDDRVRAIAWQMGMRTFLWDQDSNDWSLVANSATSHLQVKMIDSYFEQWIKNRMIGNDTDHGHITLQHENSNATILLSEKWLPKIQASFRVMPIHQCLNDPHPYWEESWIYPTLDNPNPSKPKMITDGGSGSANGDNIQVTKGTEKNEGTSRVKRKPDDSYLNSFALKVTVFITSTVIFWNI